MGDSCATVAGQDKAWCEVDLATCQGTPAGQDSVRSWDWCAGPAATAPAVPSADPAAPPAATTLAGCACVPSTYMGTGYPAQCSNPSGDLGGSWCFIDVRSCKVMALPLGLSAHVPVAQARRAVLPIPSSEPALQQGRRAGAVGLLQARARHNAAGLPVLEQVVGLPGLAGDPRHMRGCGRRRAVVRGRQVSAACAWSQYDRRTGQFDGAGNPRVCLVVFAGHPARLASLPGRWGTQRRRGTGAGPRARLRSRWQRRHRNMQEVSNTGKLC